MNEELEIMRFGHIRVTIQSDFTCDNGKQHYNKPETMLFTTMIDTEIKSIVLEDEDYHKLVARLLEQCVEIYKEKHF